MQTSAAEVTTDELALLPDAIQPERDFSDPANFINRELSWLEFNRRVLEEAQDPTQPLIERVKFMTIFSNNLDEFFEIRVAGIKQQIQSETSDVGPDGMSPTETFNAIQRLVHELVATQYDFWKKELMPALAKNGIRLHDVAQLTGKRAAWAKRYFQEEVFPMLTPLAVDASHPFPQLLNKSHNLLVRARAHQGGEPLLAIVQVPRVVPRLILMPRGKGDDEPWDYIYLASLIKHYIAELFPGLILDGVHAFRVTRNSDLYIDEEEAENLLRTIEQELRRSSRGNAVRLEVEADCPADFRDLAPRFFRFAGGRPLQARWPAFDDASHATGDERRFRQAERSAFPARNRSGPAAAGRHFRGHAQAGYFAASSLREFRSRCPLYRECRHRSAGAGDQDYALSHQRWFAHR
jgi:Polyphosphate kinase